MCIRDRDTGAGLHFWQLVNELFFNGELKVESKECNQGLLEAASQICITAVSYTHLNKIFAKLGSDYKKPDAITTMYKSEFKQKAWSCLLYTSQTPMRGHPVFIAQHATATCCRECIRKWHKMQPGKGLSQVPVSYTHLDVYKRQILCLSLLKLVSRMQLFWNLK